MKLGNLVSFNLFPYFLFSLIKEKSQIGVWIMKRVQTHLNLDVFLYLG